MVRVASGVSGKILTALSCLLLLSTALGAHDIPTDVTVQAFVRPEGSRLRLLVRVPLKAMRDVNFPLRGPGYLDLSKADQFLNDAAMLWVAGSIEIDEDDRRLAPPRIAAARVSLPSDRSFESYDSALQHVSGPRLSTGTDIAWDQAMLDVLFEYPIASDVSRFSIRPDFGRLALRVVTVLRFLPPGGDRARVRIHWRCRARPSRSPVASGRASIRPPGLFPHPQRQRITCSFCFA